MASLSVILPLSFSFFLFNGFSVALNSAFFDPLEAKAFYVAIANDKNPPTPGDFSHFVLALQWPVSICSQEDGNLCKSPVPRHFILKGLWPTHKNEESLVYCMCRKQLLASVSDSGDANFNLWSREWAKYGSCSGLSPTEYFQTALDLIKKVDVQKNLADLGYPPSPTARYDPSAIISDYKKKYGIGIKIVCIRDSSGQEMLAETHFQVNRDRETLESVTSPSSLCQTTHIAFPGEQYLLGAQ